MEKLIYANGHYNIWQLAGKECLRELSEFVVKENYKHHVDGFSYASVKDEMRSVYQEELQYVDNSTIFIVRNDTNKIIGSIRVFKWDRKKTLPMEKIFGINPFDNDTYGKRL